MMNAKTIFIASILLANLLFASPYGANQMTGGTDFSAVIRTDSTLWTWGRNNVGQLADSFALTKLSPVQQLPSKKWIAVKANYQHALALQQDSSLWSWGYNYRYQLGNGTNVNSSVPIALKPTYKWRAIAVGTLHSLALQSDSTLWVWGNNSDGQLGTGDGNTQTTPFQLSASTKWISIAAGTYYTMGIQADSTLWGWGRNGNGNLGDGSSTYRNTPVPIEPTMKWIAVSAGHQHTLAIRSDSTLWGFGYDGSGQLGSYSSTTPHQIDLTSKWIRIAAGETHSVALRSDSTLWTWGSNYYGQLGDNGTTARRELTQIEVGEKWVEIAAGPANTYAKRVDGTLWICGNNSYGQIGNGTSGTGTNQMLLTQRLLNLPHHGYGLSFQKEVNFTPFEVMPVLDPENRPMQFTITNQTFVTALEKNGKVEISPVLNAQGIGKVEGIATDENGLEASFAVTIEIGAPLGINQIQWLSASGGDNHTMALRTDSTLWSWGEDGYAVLGANPVFLRNYNAEKVLYQYKWARLSAGVSHNLLLRNDSTLWSLGSNYQGELGNSSTVTHQTLTAVAAGKKWIQIFAGDERSMGIAADSSLWSWGLNQQGQVGDGTKVIKYFPTQIAAGQKWLQANGFFKHSAAIRSDSTLWVWGLNTYGQLGDGTTTEKLVPTQIQAAKKWLQVSASAFHTLAIRSDSSLWAWGLNSSGQLGDKSWVDKSTPVQIAAGQKWIAVSGGLDYSFAIRSDSTLWAWGLNSSGQLGDGTTINRNQPVQIMSSMKWIQIHGSIKRGIAIRSDSTLWLWGSNDNGQLGTGTTDARSIPDILRPISIQSSSMPGVLDLSVQFSRQTIDMTDYLDQSILQSIDSIELLNVPKKFFARADGQYLVLESAYGVHGRDTLHMIITGLDGSTTQLALPVLIGDDIATTSSAPVIASPFANLQFDEDFTPENILLNTHFTDPDGDALSYVAVSKKGIVDVTINASTLTISPRLNKNGVDTIALVARDPYNAVQVARFQVTVLAVNDAPILTALKTISISEESYITPSFSQIATATDAEGETMTLVFSPGDHYTLSGNRITPEADFNGTLLIPTCVTDGNMCSNSMDFSLVITPVNDAPVLVTTLDQSMKQGDTLLLDLSMVVATDVEDQPLTLQLHPGTNYTTNGLEVIPNPDFVGELWVSVNVTDGTAGSNYQYLVIVVESYGVIVQNPMISHTHKSWMHRFDLLGRTAH